MAPIRPRRILIIDDNVSLAENIAEILRLDGHITEVAANGEEALRKALPADPEIVVTDYRLPNMTGTALLRQMRAMGLNVVAIVISAYSDEQTMAAAHAEGAAFVPKPIDLEVLGRLIRE